MKKSISFILSCILVLLCVPFVFAGAEDIILTGSEAAVAFDGADYFMLNGKKYEKNTDPSFNVLINVSDCTNEYSQFRINGKTVAKMVDGDNNITFKASDLVEGENELLVVIGAGNAAYNDSLVYGTFNLDDTDLNKVRFLNFGDEMPAKARYYLPIVGNSGVTIKDVDYKDGIRIADGWFAETGLGGSMPNSPLMVGILFDKPVVDGAFVIDTKNIPDGKYEIEFFDSSDKSIGKQNVTVDNTAPVITFSAPQNANLSRLDNLTIDVKDGVKCDYTIKVDGKDTSKINLNKLSFGRHTVFVTATDAVGNVGNAIFNFNLTDNPYKVTIDKDKVTMSVLGDATLYGGSILNYIRMYENRTGDFNLKALRSDDEVLVSFDDKAELTTSAIGNSNPYQSFVINTQEAKGDSVIVSYSGETGNGADIALNCWNYKTSSWDRIAKLASGGEVSVEVKLEDYSYDYKMRVNAMPILSSNGSDTLLWNSDTQYYSRYDDLNEFYTAITNYAVEEYNKGNLGYCIHTGDLIDQANVGDEIALAQFKVASDAQAILENNGVPNGVVVGNHDVQHKVANYQYFWKFFGEERYSKYDWFGGSLNNNMHHYDLVSLGKYDFVFLYIGTYRETDPDFIAWANEICKAYPDRNVVLCTHEYLLPSGVYSGDRAQVIWDKIVVPNENVVMVLCGHNEGVCDQLKQVGDSDRYVLEILADYQFSELGVGPQHVENGCTCDGEGYVRLMSFTDAGQVISTTYSPKAASFGVDPYNFFPSYSDSFVYTLDLVEPDRSIKTTEFNVLCNTYKIGEFGKEEISLKGKEAFYAGITKGNNTSLSKVFVLDDYKVNYRVPKHEYPTPEKPEPVLDSGRMNVSENLIMGGSTEYDTSLVKIGLNLLPEQASSLHKTSGATTYSVNKMANNGFEVYHENDSANWVTLSCPINKTIDVTENNRVYFGVTADKNTKWNIYVNFVSKEVNFSRDENVASMFGYVNALPSDIQGTWHGYIDLTGIVDGQQTVKSIYLVAATPNTYVKFDYLFLGTSDAGKVRFVTDEKTVSAVEKAVGEKIDVPAAAYKNGYVFKGWFNDKGEELKDAITVKAGVETYTAKFEEKSAENTNKQYFNEEVRMSNLPIGKLLLIIGSVLLVLLATVVLIIKTKKSKVKEK